MDINSFVDLKPNPSIPAFRPGDTVRVHARVIEGDRERIQAFEGVVIRIRRGGVNSSFTVRRISHGIGVERIFPYYSPLIEKVEVVRVGRVRRAKLYYLRERVGKAARIKAGSRDRFEELTARAVPQHYAGEEELAEEREVADIESVDEDEEQALESEETAAASGDDVIAEAEAEPVTEVTAEAADVPADRAAPEETVKEAPAEAVEDEARA